MTRSLKSFSFEGTDLIIASLLREINTGTYIDIGANHPTISNNTYFFYQLGWRGIAVDGNPKYVKDYEILRPEDTFLNCLVSDSEKECEFTIFPDDTMSTVDEETAIRYRTRFSLKNIESYILRSTTIYDIWNESFFEDVHLLSIDIEGEEMNALKGMNIEVFRPGVISIEIKNLSLYNPLSNEVVKFLTNYGYRLVSKTPLDSIFIDPSKEYLQWVPLSIY